MLTRLRRCILLFSALALAQGCTAPSAPPPTATPLSTATSTVTPSPTPQAPTVTPTPTDAPTGTPSPTATADPLHTACDHPYLPLRLGATWEYTDGTGNWTQEVTQVAGGATTATATVVQRYANGGSVTFIWECSDAGLLTISTATDLGATQSSAKNAGSGVHLLGADLLRPGATWRFEGTQEFSNSSGQSAVSQVSTAYVAKNLETIQTVAGPFEALPVSIVFTSTSTAGASQTFTTTNWYASGVGLVYSDVRGQLKWDLVSFQIP
jgi:hypothetical protein